MLEGYWHDTAPQRWEDDVRNRIRTRVARTARAVSAVIARPPYVPPGHFYSPLTSQVDVSRALRSTEADGVDVRESDQLALATKLMPILAAPLPGPRYNPANNMYGNADAAVYRGMLRHLRPRRIVEVGSGYSTAIVLDEAISAGFADLKLTCIEPFPDRLLGLLRDGDESRLDLLRRPVQDVPLSFYAQLRPNDILFIDSTHVVKAGSDVSWLILHVMPSLAAGVVVHVHDVFWPFEYPSEWLHERRDWTENYLLHAFLIDNANWEMLLFASWLWQRHPELVPQHLSSERPGSIWLRRIS